MQALEEAQLAERRRVLSERLNGAMVKDLLEQLDDEDQAELEKFKKE